MKDDDVVEIPDVYEIMVVHDHQRRVGVLLNNGRTKQILLVDQKGLASWKDIVSQLELWLGDKGKSNH